MELAQILNNKNYASQFDFYYYKILSIGTLVVFGCLVFQSWYFDHSAVLMQIYVGMLVMNLFCLTLIRYDRLKVLSAILYSTMILVGYAVTWRLVGGINSSYAYLFVSLMVVYTSILPGYSKIVYVGLMAILTLVLSVLYTEPIHQYETFFGVEMGYIINSLGVAIVVIYLKFRFEKQRSLLNQYNQELEVVNSSLFKKKVKLLNQRQEIQSIRQNLEALIEEHTAELEGKNEQLSKYVYDNAHILRAPLSNILGLIDILEMKYEKDRESMNILGQLRTEALSLDEMVRRANAVID
ncbi:MAG: hypothetical protein OCD76_11220 [Reichenbachiella sp.]